MGKVPKSRVTLLDIAADADGVPCDGFLGDSQRPLCSRDNPQTGSTIHKKTRLRLSSRRSQLEEATHPRRRAYRIGYY